MKFYTKIILGFIGLLWLTACSGLGFNFSEKRTAIITRGGYQIAITGDVDDEVTSNVLRVINGIGKYPYIDAHFNENLNVNMHSSDTSTDTTSSSSSMNSSRTRQNIYDVQP